MHIAFRKSTAYYNVFGLHHYQVNNFGKVPLKKQTQPPVQLTNNQIPNSDLDAILRLSEGVYFGCDYLPHALESWLGEEERNPGGKRRNLSLVERASGRTVGYQCIYFMDDFARAACVALRVGEEARGLGLGTQFIRLGEEEVRRISPEVRARVLNV